MRVAMFTDSFLPARDGVVNSILTTKAQLERLGHDVYIFAPEPCNGHREEGVFYFRLLSYKRCPGYSLSPFPTNKCEILNDLDVDVIHTHGLLFMGVRSMFAARTMKLPVVVSFHTMITDAAKYYAPMPIPEWMTNRLFWIYLKQLLERADSVVAPTAAIKSELLSYAPAMHRVDIIPTGVDCERFRPDNDGSVIRHRYGLDGERVLLHVGRIAFEKNLDLVIEGYSRLVKKDPQVRLLIVGEGPAKKHYQECVREMGLEGRIIFTGFIPDEELPSVYAACDASVIASKFETQGLVGLEAMASGKPVAGINYRAVKEMIHKGENGFLFEDNPDSCSEAMGSALDHAEEMRWSARRYAMGYSVELSVEKLVELYKYSIERKKMVLDGKVF
ncbi:MAG: glycosyltransferase [Methanomassiliicoccus sp.]|nr:glycosyltransferase [Methanomassiliicoccus sp.]